MEFQNKNRDINGPCKRTHPSPSRYPEKLTGDSVIYRDSSLLPFTLIYGVKFQ